MKSNGGREEVEGGDVGRSAEHTITCMQACKCIQMLEHTPAHAHMNTRMHDKLKQLHTKQIYTNAYTCTHTGTHRHSSYCTHTVMITVTPLSARFRSSWHISSEEVASKPDVGSSTHRTAGEDANVTPTLQRFRSPPLTPPSSKYLVSTFRRERQSVRHDKPRQYNTKAATRQ